MKKQTILIALALVLPLCGFSQNWSKDEQACLDHLTKTWAELSNKPITWENWKATVHPDDELTWWWTNEGAPKDLNANKNALLNFEKEGQFFNYGHVRPIRINIVGDVGMIWFYGYMNISDKAGNVTNFEDKRLEVFKRDGAGWKFLGGMVDPVD